MDIGALNQQPSWRQPGRRPTSPARGLRGGSQGNRFPDLTREERGVLIKFHGCFECRRLHADHTAANCPEKRQKAKGGDGRGPNFLMSMPLDAQEENRQRTSPVRATGERSDDEWVRRPDECPQWIQEFWKEQEEEVSNGEIAELSRSETPIKMPQTAPKWGMPKRLISGEGYTDEQIEEIQRDFEKRCGEKETGGNEIEKSV
uniref:Uncharacterized protein n=1 Tax=Chromera velia CCMP2878 TaxID=1169474 RepID=A0A0G4HE45_9ALVE|eukprot:Cvel_26517.t1-p1 / transcript=Cvel_26517.t1 / gene=Cvel_26517 / organism=Chromera_velia_CCMP2878 / gene_product=hypothetical protein / transcript_product=hypothetical protein / location=Cvel_scaffold3166:13557-14162(-) / protein_length=202 / sequence_SO=supercontig / SO=protein_coding / is_pseudo=false